MIILTGEIGKLSLNGEQVGGFKYWTAVVNKNTNSTTVIASQFYMFERLMADTLEAEFYAEVGENLKLVYNKDVKVSFPQHELDTMTTAKLEMHIDNFNWLG